VAVLVYTRSFRQQAPATSAQTIVIAKAEPDTLLRIERVVAADDTTNITDIGLQLVQGDKVDLIGRVTVSGIGDLAMFDDLVIRLTEGMALQLRYTGVVSEDILRAVVFGLQFTGEDVSGVLASGR